MLVSSLSVSFVIQPMLKYIAEGYDAKSIASTAFTMMAGWAVLIFVLFLIFIIALNYPST